MMRPAIDMTQDNTVWAIGPMIEAGIPGMPMCYFDNKNDALSAARNIETFSAHMRDVYVVAVPKWPAIGDGNRIMATHT